MAGQSRASDSPVLDGCMDARTAQLDGEYAEGDETQDSISVESMEGGVGKVE